LDNKIGGHGIGQIMTQGGKAVQFGTGP
jgi:hypothetical protein